MARPSLYVPERSLLRSACRTCKVPIILCHSSHKHFLLARLESQEQRVCAARAPLTIYGDRDVGPHRVRSMTGSGCYSPIEPAASASSAPLQRRSGSMSIVLARRLRRFHSLLEMALRVERARPRPDDHVVAGIQKKRLASRTGSPSSTVARCRPPRTSDQEGRRLPPVAGPDRFPTSPPVARNGRPGVRFLCPDQTEP